MDSDATLIEYLLGLSDPAQSAAIAERCRDDPTLTAKLAALDGGIRKVADAHAQTPGLALRDRLMRSLEADTRFNGFLQRARHFLDLSVAATQRVLAIAAQRPNDIEASFAGVYRHPVALGERRAGCTGSLIWVAPECQIPRHVHHGEEWGFILQGRLVDDLGANDTVGDYVCSEAGSIHTVSNPGVETAIVLNLIEKGYDWLT